MLFRSKLADYSEEEPIDTGAEVETEPTAAAPEKAAPAYFHSGSEDSSTIADADKFREILKTKYGADSVSDLSHAERAELMASMNFGPEKKEPQMDFSKFAASDAEKAEFAGRDTKRLDFLAANAGNIQSLADYSALASQYKAETGENMHHPMAILASIQAMPKGSEQRNRLAAVERVLQSQMNEGKEQMLSMLNRISGPVGSEPKKPLSEVQKMRAIMEKVNAAKAATPARINEDRKPSTILNVEKLGKENEKNFKNDSREEDALQQEKTYPKDGGIHKSKVWPLPNEFYIEQDLEKVQREAKSAADIEREVLAKTQGSAFKNVGDSTNEKGNEIPKRNLTKDEMYSLAMNRGDGMQDIVYDAKPSDRFEKRMETDFGRDVYAARKEKMQYRADAPMYNKDTQPTEKGDKALQDDKFKKGYNSESVNAKYTNEFGKVQIFEFAVADIKDVVVKDKVAFSALIAEGKFGYKLSLDGLGNKYSLVGKKINENRGFTDILESVDFYLVDGNVLAVEKSDVVANDSKPSINESIKGATLDKMKKLMNYNSNTYVNAKNSVKY